MNKLGADAFTFKKRSEAMNCTILILGVSALLIASVVFVGCDRNPVKARVHVNRGSCLQAVQAGIGAVRKYGEEHGHLPKSLANLAELGESSVPTEISSMLQYGGSDSLSLKSSERIIVLKCVFPVSSPNGVTESYCALLSGEILLLPEKDAIIGKPCPPGIGRVMVAKP